MNEVRAEVAWFLESAWKRASTKQRQLCVLILTAVRNVRKLVKQDKARKKYTCKNMPTVCPPSRLPFTWGPGVISEGKNPILREVNGYNKMAAAIEIC